MKSATRVFLKLKTIYQQWSLRKVVRFGTRVYLGGETSFEGGNAIANSTKFIDSTLGAYSYCASNSYIRNTKIGRFCSIGKNVRTIDVTHPTEFVSTHPVFYSPHNAVGKTFVSTVEFDEHLHCESEMDYSIVIGNDVWICDGAQIIGGNTIGNGAIIAAGAVVTKDVPDFSIVAGVPAKVIRYRFSEEEIKYLSALQWWDKDKEWLQANAKYFRDINLLRENNPL